VDVSQVVGVLAGGGAGGAVTAGLLRLLAASWLREQRQRDEAIEARFSSLEKSTDEKFDAVEQLVKSLGDTHQRELDEARRQQGLLFGEIRKLSSQISYLNGQLAARGLVRPPTAEDV
jgi:hypothetical protein